MAVFETIVALLIIAGLILLIVGGFSSFARSAVKKNNQRKLVNSIYEQMINRDDDWWAVSSEVRSGNHASVLIHRYSGKKERYGFKEHGYACLSEYGMRDLFQTLERKTHGKLHYSYKDIGGVGSSTITSFSEGFAPGGGTAFYANTSDSVSGSALIGLTLYCPEYKRQLKEKQRKEREEVKRYKKTF